MAIPEQDERLTIQRAEIELFPARQRACQLVGGDGREHLHWLRVVHCGDEVGSALAEAVGEKGDGQVGGLGYFGFGGGVGGEEEEEGGEEWVHCYGFWVEVDSFGQ